MANERPVINLTKKVDPLDDARKKEFKARAAQFVNRGFTVDRLNVKLPDDVYGEWIADDPASISAAQMMGFEIDKTHANANALHSDGQGNAKIGDVIFMTMPKWQKEVLDELKQEEYDRFHGIRGKGKPAEETQYANNISRETPLHNESSQTVGELTGLIDNSN